jgi:hypothetical protein
MECRSFVAWAIGRQILIFAGRAVELEAHRGVRNFAQHNVVNALLKRRQGFIIEQTAQIEITLLQKLLVLLFAKVGEGGLDHDNFSCCSN